MRKMFLLFIAGALVYFFSANIAEASMKAYKLFKETYPNLGTYNCAICHTGKVGKKDELNSYGKSLGLVLPAELTAEQLRVAEALDPDGSGVSFGKKIEACTLPVDFSSAPQEK